MIVAIGFVLVALVSNRGWTQTSASPGPTEELIVQARQKGIAFLKSKQHDEGNWKFPGHEVGITALCTLALLENGVPQSDPAIEKGQRYVKKNVKELGSTYDITLAIVILSRLDEHGNKSIIRDLGARLIAGQNTGGGWSYSCPAKVTALSLTNPDSRPKPPEGPGDNSCTQFGVLGLWTASRSGVDIDSAMSAGARRFKTTQNADGGWPYTTVVDKNLTIAAGFGYLPTFVYEIGFDARGIRSRPDKDPEARYFLKVSNTSLTLEGLKFDFNPPELAQNIPWSVLRIAGGEQFLIVGAGRAFSRYRESSLYNDWKNSLAAK